MHIVKGEKGNCHKTQTIRRDGRGKRATALTICSLKIQSKNRMKSLHGAFLPAKVSSKAFHLKSETCTKAAYLYHSVCFNT